MAIASFWIGLVALLVTIGAFVFAFISASRADILLKRLVIYPFRDLDQAWASLKESERQFILNLFRRTNMGKGTLSIEAMEDFATTSQEYRKEMLNFLIERGWIDRTDAGIKIHGDKSPYLNFIMEAEE